MSARRRLWWLAAVVAVAASAAEDERPEWEAGVGIGAVAFPAYRGATEYDVWPFPMPYLVYRGPYLRIDRSDISALLVDEPRVRFGFSLNASPPVSSRATPLREGLPALRPTIEAGPSMDLSLWRAKAGDARLWLQLPLRAAVTVERSPDVIGLVSGVYLNLDRDDVAGVPGVNLGLRVGPSFQSRGFNRYYYDVPSAQARADRPAYSADGGYAGTSVTLSLSRRTAGYWVGGFVRYETLAGASFIDSPLVQTRRVIAGGVAVAWILSRSDSSVPPELFGR